MTASRNRWLLIIGANVLVVCMLSFYRTTGAAPQAGQQPFANAVDQRNDMIRELKEIRALLQEQNAILRGDPTSKNSNGSRPPKR